MNPVTALHLLLPAAMKLFDRKFFTPEAAVMLLAIALQESDFKDRRQLVGHHRKWWQSLGGPAASFWQFEKTGIRGVLENRTTGPLARDLLAKFGYPPDDLNTIHEALVHNDLLACVFARLTLWQLPQPLPSPTTLGQDEGWRQYLQAWRPGKPKPERWPERWRMAIQIVNSNRSMWEQ